MYTKNAKAINTQVRKEKKNANKQQPSYLCPLNFVESTKLVCIVTNHLTTKTGALHYLTKAGPVQREEYHQKQNKRERKEEYCVEKATVTRINTGQI